MELGPFLIGEWLERKLVTNWQGIDLASSTGPVWTAESLLSEASPAERETILNAPLTYTSSRGSDQLREALAAAYELNPKHVQLTTGASEALHIIFFTEAKPGTNVVVPEPGYPPFSSLPEAFGVEVRTYRLQRESAWSIDAGEIEQLIDGNTRIVVLNSPHNPTGAIIRSSELKRLHDYTAERGVVFVVDEVYHPVYHGEAAASAVKLPHATVVGDISKALCLAGLRVGWIIEPNAERRRAYYESRAQFTISNSSICEAMAVAALRQRDRILNAARARTGRNLALLTDFFAANSKTFGWVAPRGGMTAFPWLRNGENARNLCERAMNQGVSLLPGDCFGVPDHFRIGFGTVDTLELKEGLARLTASVAA